MKQKYTPVMAVLLCCLYIIGLLSGCIEEERKLKENLISPFKSDQPLILPDWDNRDYHDFYATVELLQEFQIDFPYLVNVFSIGKSVQNRDIWCIRITNENSDNEKYSCLIDGCIHGCEWEAGEACLYLAEYLLINNERNNTISSMLNSSEIYIIPLVNPDGRQYNSRFNDNGIDLNRNFDVDFGRLKGASLPIGKLFGRIKIPYVETPRLNKWLKEFPPYLSNCGRRPFSEPESQAIKNLIEQKDFSNMAFYVNCHTAAHGICHPWMVFKPPFDMSSQERTVFNHILRWVEENTEYEALSDLSYKGKKVYLSGQAQDWIFKECHVPSFSFEILSMDYEMFMGTGKHDHLIHWMNTTLPFFMYLLANIEHLYHWNVPDIQPLLPEGVPPKPLGSSYQ